MSWIDLSLPITDPTWIFLIVLSIIMFAPMLFNKLRIPNIIGMILAGIIVGEHGLNILARDSSFELFGNVGLYYIMFLAGLEINMGDFRKNRNKAIVLGLLAFIIPIALGFVVNVSYLKYGIATSILLASMYASHTLIAYPIVLRLGISKHRSVSISVGATAVTDTLTLLVLAVISGIYQGAAGEMFWIKLIIKVVLVGAFIMYSLPRMARWFFRKYDDTIMQFIFVLVLLFLAAGLMEIAGMEGILGAFLAGLLLNRLIPDISPLKNHLEFIGNALFIPYFLIGVGMLINLRVIFGEGDALKVAAVMTVTALTGKWLACLLTQKIYGMSATERRLIYGLSNAQAAATLAAVLVGYNILLPDGQRLLNEDVLNGTILLILITCVVSSIITEHAGKKLAVEAPIQDSTSESPEEKILIPVANPDTVKDLVCMSLAIRNQRSKDGLYALSIVNDSDAAEEGSAGNSSTGNLDYAAKIAASSNVDLKKLVRYDINTVSGIVHTVKEQNITSVIIGLRKDSTMKNPNFGPLATNLLKGLHCEIMITRMMVPINTLKEIIIAVPPKAEYEAGFQSWVSHLCRLGASLERRLQFYAPAESIGHLRAFISGNFRSTEASFKTMSDITALPSMVGNPGKDSLLVIVSSRQGSISHDSSLDKIPKLLGKDFFQPSLMFIYPEKYDITGHSLN